MKRERERESESTPFYHSNGKTSTSLERSAPELSSLDKHTRDLHSYFGLLTNYYRRDKGLF